MFSLHSGLRIFCLLLLLVLLYGSMGYGKNITTGTININTANQQQLELLPGIGEATAKKIILSRKVEGDFKTKEELINRALVQKRYVANLIPLISVSGLHRYDDPNKMVVGKSGNNPTTTKKYTNRRKDYTINLSPIFKQPEAVQLLTDGSYFPVLRQSIREAKKSIWISTFTFRGSRSPTNKPMQLIQLLKDRAADGVKVYVVLEQSNYHAELSKENQRIGKLLSSSGVQVYFDALDNTMHSKLAVIDQKQVFVGSHNMTDSALSRNHEVSVVIVSEALATEVANYLKSVAEE